MKIYLEKAIFVNRAPFEKLELNFNENEIAVLSAVNGMGKTTILSHIVDAFYEMARTNFPDDFKGNDTNYYRISSMIHNINMESPSFVYLRFKSDKINFDYTEIDKCTQKEYDEAIILEDKIPFSMFEKNFKNIEHAKIKSKNFDSDKIKKFYINNILTYFPSYRYEQPGYLTDPYMINIDFKKKSNFFGHLNSPIEVIAGLPKIANWIMDIILDSHDPEGNANFIKKHLDLIITQTLISKNYGDLSFEVGPRNFGSTRIQIIKKITSSTVYPTIFNLSSGEASMLCLFGELVRQTDNKKNVSSLNEISGIVLVDEIDKHLHIKLQKEVLPKLFNLFPNVQFIVSSHSPFLSMGLAEEAQERSKIVDLDNLGISNNPTSSELYTEVYKMMISENERFKEMYESINSQIETTKTLQIVTEGKNTEHIEKAISTLDPNLIAQIKIIKGSEDKTGNRQLKNAFDIMSKGTHSNKFLFVWDCDSIGLVDKVIETDKFFKYCFEKNTENAKADKGIENLYSESFFSEDVYDERNTKIEYGGTKTEKIFKKNKFLEKIKKESSADCFQKFKPLVIKIREII